MMLLQQIPAFVDDNIHVIIETPRGSQNKYVYEPGWQVFKLKKALPTGMVFPFDFGFVPNTLAEDGDAIDVLVLMEEASYPGCLLTCRVIGALEVQQTEVTGKKVRNDRIIAIAEASHLYRYVKRIEDLNEHYRGQIEQFFINYNEQEGKKFKALGWVDPEKAIQLIKNALINKQ